jgi:guanylate kinase
MQKGNWMNSKKNIATNSNEQGLFIVVSAPSGAGKTSICKEVLKMLPNIRFSVSYTTRPPRPKEEDGKDYYFISDFEFKKRIAEGEFAEWAENFGYLYGTSGKTMKDFLEKGYDLILDVDPRGARELKKNYPGGIFVFVLPPSIDELKVRLRQRGFEEEKNIEKRFQKAMDEIKEIVWYDYIVINDSLNSAIDNLRSIYVAEKSRRERLTEKIKGFMEVFT